MDQILLCESKKSRNRCAAHQEADTDDLPLLRETIENPTELHEVEPTLTSLSELAQLGNLG